MGHGLDSIRRKTGLVVLALAGLMLVAGQTVLKSSLEGMGFLLYWFACFFFTLGAILIALFDMRAVRRQTREETHALLEKTLADVERKAEEKAAAPKTVAKSPKFRNFGNNCY